MTVYNVAVADAVKAASASGSLFAGSIAIQDNARARDRQSLAWAYAGIVTDSVRISSTFKGAAVNAVSLSTRFKVRDKLANQIALMLRDQAAIRDSLGDALAVQLIERLVAKAMLSSQGVYNGSLVTTARARDILMDGLAAVVFDKALARDTTGYSFAVVGQLADVALAYDIQAEQKIAIVTLEDELAADDDTTVEGIYEMLVDDLIIAGSSMAEPDGGLTAWVLNARSGGVTEYTNWPFNSYVKLGDRYVGAAESGLYELVGDADQKQPIIAHIRTGDLELTGSMLTGLKDAYVAVRGDGEMFLRVRSEKLDVTYRVRLSSMLTSRVSLGKGWRARYISWELITVGQDFDLTGLEFLPISSARRTG